MCLSYSADAYLLQLVYHLSLRMSETPVWVRTGTTFRSEYLQTTVCFIGGGDIWTSYPLSSLRRWRDYAVPNLSLHQVSNMKHDGGRSYMCKIIVPITERGVRSCGRTWVSHNGIS